MQTTEQTIEAAAESLLIMPEAKSEEAKPETEAEPEEVSETVDAETEADEAESTEDVEAVDEATEEDTEEAAPQKFTVKVDGKDTEVSLDDLKRSYSGQAYIQKGMQEAAAAKKEAQAIYEALQTGQAKFIEIVQAIQSDGFVPPPVAPSPELAKSDPIGYIQANADYNAQLDKYQKQQAQIQHVTRQQQELQGKAMAEHVAEQRRLLSEKIPEFSDPVKGKAIQEKIRKIGGEAYGFTDQELGAVIDARHVQVLYDAMRWRELQSGKVQPKKPDPPKVVKPQAKVSQPAQLARAKQMEAAKKSGNIRDFAELLLVPKQR